MGTKGKRLQPGEKPPEPRRPKSNGDTNRDLLDIELALAEHFSWKKNIIAFNVLGVSGILPLFHECDMLVVSPSGYLTEVEIKRSFADFCADFKKKHRHESQVPLKEFIFAIPEDILQKVVEKLSEERFIPTYILTYDEELDINVYPVYQALDTEKKREYRDWYWENERAIVILTPKDGKGIFRPVDLHRTGPLFLEQRLEIARLGAMRQVALRKRIKEVRENALRNPDETLETKIAELKILLHEYRSALKEATGGTLDEKEILYG